MELKFYIGKNGMARDQGLQTDKFIFKTSDRNPPIGVGGDFEGPFKSIHDLTLNSSFYAELKSQNPRTAAKLILPKNINEVQNFLLIPKGKTFDMQFYVAIQHALKAEFKKGEIQGLHFYNPRNTKIVKIYGRNHQGVVDADIMKFESDTQKWYKKRTTLFPFHWNVGNLFAELDVAYLYRFLIPGSKNRYGAVTPNGTKVVFVFVDGKAKTVYPIL